MPFKTILNIFKIHSLLHSQLDVSKHVPYTIWQVSVYVQTAWWCFILIFIEKRKASLQVNFTIKILFKILALSKTWQRFHNRLHYVCWTRLRDRETWYASSSFRRLWRGWGWSGVVHRQARIASVARPCGSLSGPFHSHLHERRLLKGESARRSTCTVNRLKQHTSSTKMKKYIMWKIKMKMEKKKSRNSKFTYPKRKCRV